jgi:predicted nucleic acid-binding protein
VWLRDANIIRAFGDSSAEGHDRVITRSSAIGWETIGIPIVVAAELLEGRLRFLREAHRRATRQLLTAFDRLDATIRFVSSFPIVAFDGAALRIYERRQMFPGTMSRDDRLIAAIALAGGHRLVTRNVSHFVGIPGLVIETWIDDSDA